jgi:hypothetical protein
MSARRKSANKRRAPAVARIPKKVEVSEASRRQMSSMLASAESVLDECIAAISFVDVTVHSLELREIASSEQEVLKRALKAIWLVHDWVDELKLHDRRSSRPDREIERHGSRGPRRHGHYWAGY